MVGLLNMRIWIILGLISLSFSHPCSAQRTIFVSAANGDDSFSVEQAQNFATPWNSIQLAIDNAQPGDEIRVGDGIYKEELEIRSSGAPGAPIRLVADACAVPVIDGRNRAITLLSIRDASHWVIQGFHFRNAVGPYAEGISIGGGCDSLTIRNNVIQNIAWTQAENRKPGDDDNAYPIIVLGDAITPITNLLVEGNEIFNNITGFSEALAINGNVDGFILRNNLIHHNTNIGIDAIGFEGTLVGVDSLDYARNGIISGNKVYACHSTYDCAAAGIYVDGASQIVIENNITFDNDRGIEIGCENPGRLTQDILVRNNLIYLNSKAGLAIGGYDGPVNTGTVADLTISGNTFFANARTQPEAGEIEITYGEDWQIRNNIFVARGAPMLVLESDFFPINLQMDYNCYFSLNANENTTQFTWEGNYTEGFQNFVAQSGQDTHSFFSNPELISPNFLTPDLHLSAGSTCVNAGDSTFLILTEMDIDGESRVWDNQVDMGADEFESALVALPNAPGKGNDLLKWISLPDQRFQLIPQADVVIQKVELFSFSGQSIGVQWEGNLIAPTVPISGPVILKVQTSCGEWVQKIFIRSY
jgi:Right handed beta helix region